MLFNSIPFAMFLPIVFVFYWLMCKNSVKLQNIFLLVASYFFYAYWDWRFLSLILLCSVTNYVTGLLLIKTNVQSRRKLLVTIACSVSFGVLGLFKYYDFFVNTFVDMFSLLGVKMQVHTLKLILPVGISFYTFHTLSYTFDVYRRNFEPTKNIMSFFLFVSIFPLAMAGPIERATNLLPQIYKKRIFDYKQTAEGLRLILWGLFCKIVIADRLAIFVDGTYGNIETAKGLPLICAVIFFAFQLYLDFAAYSNIAIGTGKILGFNIIKNFNRPYLSASFSEFWKRWHISLSSWFRDYVYIPLGGNRKGMKRMYINFMIVFLLSGLWHGASWNFAIWGIINGLFVVVVDKLFCFGSRQGFRAWFAPMFISVCWALSLIFFRTQNFLDAISVFSNIGFSGSENLYSFGLLKLEFRLALWLVIGIMIFEVIMEKDGEKLRAWFVGKNALIVRWFVYLLLIFSIIYLGSYGAANDNTFIYFQF